MAKKQPFLTEEFLARANEEQRHADQIAARIVLAMKDG